MSGRTIHGFNRSRPWARIAAIAALAMMAGALSATTSGAAAAAPAAAVASGCSEVSRTTFTNNTPLRIPQDPEATSGLTTSAITVHNAGPVLHDVDVFTDITHAYAADIDMTLKSPEGTIVTLTTDNGGSKDNVFAGTLWDDDADPGSPLPYPGGSAKIATDYVFTNLAAAPTLVPEEAMSAFKGENPNGTWTLTINDDGSSETGMLNSWKLHLTTMAADETSTSEQLTVNDVVRPISFSSFTESTITIDQAGSKIADVNALVMARHTNSSDLEMSVKSPEGTVVTLTTRNGSGDDNFAGTSFDDDADPGNQVPYLGQVKIVTEFEFTDTVAASTLVPEEAMGAFNGENPNGKWTLRILDRSDNSQNGSLIAWGLDLTTSVCDTTVSGVNAKYSSKLKNKKYLYIRVRVGEPAKIRITGKAKGGRGGYAKFKTTTKAAKPGKYVTFKIRLAKKATKLTKRRKAKGKAEVYIRVTDRHGNVKKLKKIVKYHR